MALEKIVIQVGGQTDLESTIKKLTELGLIDKKNAESFVHNSKNVGEGLKKQEVAVSNLSHTLKGMGEALPGAEIVHKLTSIFSSVNGVTGAVKGATSGFKALKIAIASTGIGLLIAAVASLVSYFKTSSEGADKLKVILAAMEAVFTVLTKAVNVFGKMIFEAVTNPLEAVKKLGSTLLNAFLHPIDTVNNIAKSIREIAEQSIEAAKHAAHLAIELDKIETIQRKLNVDLAENEKFITRLLIQAKNRTLSEEARIKILEKAGALELATSTRSIQLAKEELKLIQDENEFLKANGQLLSEEKDKEAAAKIKVFNLEKDNLLRIERIKNGIDFLNQEMIDKEIEAQRKLREEYFKTAAAHQKSFDLENAAVDKLLEVQQQGRIDAENNIASNEKKSDARRIRAINTRILEEVRLVDLLVNEQLLKNEAGEAGKLLILEQAKNEKVKIFEKGEKEIDAIAKAADDKKRAREKEVLQRSIELAGNIANAYLSTQLANDIALIDAERTKNETQTQMLLKNLDKRQQAGRINELTSAALKENIQKQAAKKEADLKRKQWEAEKKANIQKVIIDTAVAVAKTFAQLGWPAGIVGATFAAANGAVQVATIQAQPTPAFKEGVIDFKGKGTQTSDSNLVRISNRESVINARSTLKYKDVLEAINNDTYYKKYVMPEYIKDSLEDKRHTSMGNNIAKALVMGNSNFNDAALVDAIKRNKRVKIENLGDLVRGNDEKRYSL